MTEHKKHLLQGYQTLAVRTAKMFPEFTQNLNHAALGIGSEPGELAETVLVLTLRAHGYELPVPSDSSSTITEELGDALWYPAYLCEVIANHTGVSCLLGRHVGEAGGQFADILAVVAESGVQTLAVLAVNAAAGELVSQAKKVVIYEREPDFKSLLAALSNYVAAVLLAIELHGLDLEAVLTANICKLQTRFPAAYSDEAAVARADKESSHGQ